MQKTDERLGTGLAQAHHYFAAPLSWNALHWQRLTQRYPQLPHAILLSGMIGTGKRQFADRLCAWLLCASRTPSGACGECASCQWLKADTHPGLLRISPEADAKGKKSQFIKIDQIRQLMPFVQQTGERWRVVIIEPAEALNIAAANALLKTLEEPGEKVLLILVTDQLLQLPATIRSRLQQYPVGLVEHAQAVDYVVQQLGVPLAQAQLLLDLSGGAPLAAVQLNQQESFLARQDWLADFVRLLRGHLTPLAASSAWQKRLGLWQWLDMQEWMLRDLIAVQLGQPVRQTDLKLQGFAGRLNLEALFGLQQQVIHSKQYQNQNIQVSLIYDSLMMQLINLKVLDSARATSAE